MSIPLTHRAVVDGALDLVEAQGFSMLTMRALGTRLGIRGASLYHWVPSRQVLLHDMASLLDEHVVLGVPVVGTAAAEWPDVVQRLVRGLRVVCSRFPRSAPLLLGLPTDQPWIRAPLRSAAPVEELLCALRRSGFSRTDAVAAYRIVTTFLVGELLLTTAGTTTDGRISPGRRPPPGAGQPVDLGPHPVVGALQDLMAQPGAPATSHDPLDLLLVRLDALRLR